jgi:hypothetical protein
MAPNVRRSAAGAAWVVAGATERTGPFFTAHFVKKLSHSVFQKTPSKPPKLLSLIRPCNAKAS